jgi:limonene-1,2-epoxide hydrolase
MKWTAILVAALALAGCGGSATRSPAQVARAWSAALNDADDRAAAKLFAPGATVIQDSVLTLDTRADAVAWNHALPCGGSITRVLKRANHEVLVLFHLKERRGHRCDAPGATAAAVLRVENGKIVLWHQTTPPGEESQPTV